MQFQDFPLPHRSVHLRLMLVPYDSGVRGARMGAGPEHLLDLGLGERLREAGHEVTTQTVELPPSPVPGEVRSVFELATDVAAAVRACLREGALPLVLSGNCGPAALGAVAAMGPSPAVIWFDAHGDLNTPETTRSGFVDGMALATVMGRCWTGLSSTLTGFSPVPRESVVLVGVRDMDPPETAVVRESSMIVVPANRLRTELPGALRSHAACGASAYIHLDLDVLDAGEARANAFASAGGLSVADAAWALETIAASLPVGVVAVTAYDPAADSDGAAGRAAIDLCVSLASAVEAAAHD